MQLMFSSSGGGGGGGSGNMVMQSYSYSSSVGPDGRPVVRETRHSAINDGHLREERYEHYDGRSGQREAGLARAIEDRSVAVRKISRDDAPDDAQTETHVENVAEDEIPIFDADWQRSTSQNPTFTEAHRVSTLPLSAGHSHRAHVPAIGYHHDLHHDTRHPPTYNRQAAQAGPTPPTQAGPTPPSFLPSTGDIERPGVRRAGQAQMSSRASGAPFSRSGNYNAQQTYHRAGQRPRSSEWSQGGGSTQSQSSARSQGGSQPPWQ